MAHLQKRGERLHVYTTYTRDPLDAFANDVLHGLSAPQKFLPAKYFYDGDGSKLYEQICDLPEYYPYRAEKEILATYAAAIHAELGHLALVELGSGNAAKTRYLLAEYERAGQPFLYCPVDIARSMLETSAEQLLRQYPHVVIQALHADFADHPEVIQVLQTTPKAVAFFGSSLGNFTWEESVTFVQRTARIMGPDDVFLLGIDLKKSTAILVPAYDDAQGVTAAFNLNILRRINRELGGNFHLGGFAHLVLYNEAYGRIEMYLRSRTAQQVCIAKTAQRLTFSAGETIHTENSYKYTVEEVHKLGRQANLGLDRTWFDRQGYFLVGLFRPLT
ncbi:Histidine N-alpha-methyltransferase [Candidatus Entotheonellaceae bacterium PAL068K]